MISKSTLVSATSLLTSVLLSACATHEPTFGEKLQGRADEVNKIGEQWTDGETLINQGSEMQKSGREDIRNGELLIAGGKNKINEGTAMIAKGKGSERKAEKSYQVRVASPVLN